MEENKELDLSAIRTFNGGVIILYYEPTNEENEQRKTDNSPDLSHLVRWK